MPHVLAGAGAARPRMNPHIRIDEGISVVARSAWGGT